MREVTMQGQTRSRGQASLIETRLGGFSVLAGLGTAIAVLMAVALAPGAAHAQTITQIIDSTGDGAGNPLSRSYGIAVDGSGNVYVAGEDSDNAFKITPGGVITEIIDSTGDGGGNTLQHPWDVAVDGSGNVYVAGADSDNAFKITPGGVITEIIDSTGDGSGNALNRPFGVAVDGSGNVYVTGLESHNAFKVTPGGVITQIIDITGDGGGNGLLNPPDVAVDGSGNVYVVGTPSDNAFQIDPNGTVTKIIDSTGDGAGNPCRWPRRIAVDGAGNVYVTSSELGIEYGSIDNAFKIYPNGTITQIIDATGDGAGNTLFGSQGIAVDGSGNVYVTGSDGDNAFKIELVPTGIPVLPSSALILLSALLLGSSFGILGWRLHDHM
jgi:hypothetical protein